MTDDSTRGMRGVAGAGESLNDGKDDRAVPRAAICHVVHEEQVGELHLSRDNLEHLLASGSFFWIDLPRPREEDFAVLRDVFQFHPLALEDSEDFGQRSKLDDYDDFVFLVVYGAVPDEDRLGRRRPPWLGELVRTFSRQAPRRFDRAQPSHNRHCR